jgi:hypothetical protein
MSKDITKRASPANPEQPTDQAQAPDRAAHQAAGVTSRVKHTLMEDTFGRMFGKDVAEPTAPDGKPPRVILALANHGRNPGWDRAKTLQRQLFAAFTRPGAPCPDATYPGTTHSGAAGAEERPSLEMKFAFYDPDDAKGVRRFRITDRWITDPGDMEAFIDRFECACGCWVKIRDVLEQATEEATKEATNETGERPLRAVIIVGDAFHDDQDGLDEAALSANQLRKMGTRVFLLQLGDDPNTARILRWLANVSGGVHFRYDPRTQEQQFAEMFDAVSACAAGGEEAVRASVRGGDGQAATLLLEHLQQAPMPIIEAPIETREQVDALDPDRLQKKTPASRS